MRTIAKDHDQKRLNILSVAARVFAREGIARASMNEVAKACGISKANIYHYYDGKDALLFDILDNYLTKLNERVQALNLDDLSPKDQLAQLIGEFLIAYEGMDKEHKILTEGIPLLPVKQQEILKDYQREMVTLMGSVLSRNAPSTFKDDKPLLRDMTMSIFGMLNWFYMWNGGANQKQRRAYAQKVALLCVDGFGGLGGSVAE